VSGMVADRPPAHDDRESTPAVFPSTGAVKAFLRRVEESRRAGAGSPSTIGSSGSGEPFHLEACSVLAQAWQSLCYWQPQITERWTGSPAERWARVDVETDDAINAAAQQQFRHCRAGWSTKQPPKQDTRAEAKARELWTRADKLAAEAMDLWADPDCQLALSHIGLCLALAAIEDPEHFGRYGQPT